MKSETETCQNCKKDFVIEPDDFAFYEKIKVPPPTWCPECRNRRRHAWRNERVLYRRNCDLCKKSIVTIYSPNKPFKVYCPSCWWSDKWNGLDYGRDFDFNRPFFEQFKELQREAPRIALLTKQSVRSDYTNHSNNNKDCFMGFGVFDSENVLYATNVYGGARDSMEVYRAHSGNDLIYECVDIIKCYNCQFGYLLRDSTDCSYCWDCRGCSNCFLSSNLRNKQYYFLNQPCTKEEYQKKIQQFNLGSYAEREKLYTQYLNLIRTNTLHRFATIEKSVNVSGNVILNAKNAHCVFDASDVEDAKYCIVCPDAKDAMDSYHFGFRCELIYESHALIHCYDVKFTHLSYDNSHLEYCDSCHNSENLFGCVSVKQGKYCILNKRYLPEEYESLKTRIIEHMKKTGEYGEFFPFGLSPFGYNETQGMIYMPMTKEEVLAKGWQWEDVAPGTFGKETMKSEEIPDDIKDVPDSILKEVLRCAQCKRNYNIVEPELQLYRRFVHPIPRLCPDCRYRRKIALRPPRKLWHRTCICTGRTNDQRLTTNNHTNTAKHFHGEVPCPNEFETPYAPERKEIVYCEQCYQAEVV